MLTMIRSSARAAIVAAALFVGAGLLAPSAVNAAAAGDFPPGAFSDGGRYKLSDFEGKLLVLFFYEQDCPTCRKSIPERNKVVEQFKDKPVKFIAVAAGDSLVEATGYTRDTRLMMPAFADLFGAMQAHYGFTISLRNIYEFRVIGPDGTIVGQSMEPADIERALASVKWKYKDGGYHASLAPLIDMMEWNQYEAAMPRLRPLTKTANKEIQASAAKLMAAVRAEADGWAEQAAKIADAEPVRALELYNRAAAVYGGDETGKKIEATAKKLAASKPVTDEMAARKMYDAMGAAMPKAQMKQKPQFVAQAKKIGELYPETPTGKRATELAADLEKAGAK